MLLKTAKDPFGWASSMIGNDKDGDDGSDNTSDDPKDGEQL